MHGCHCQSHIRQRWKKNPSDRPLENVIVFRKMIKAIGVILHVRVLGKVTLIDERGRRW